VLAAARRFRAELAGAIAVLEGPFAVLLDRTNGADRDSLQSLGAEVSEASQAGQLTEAQLRDLDAAWRARVEALGTAGPQP
jgi:hypothetical protein